MAMKAYACPRCLTLSSETEDGDGGVHTCTPSPFAANLEARVSKLASEVAAWQCRFPDHSYDADSDSIGEC
jgi:hypothetical protein